MIQLITTITFLRLTGPSTVLNKWGSVGKRKMLTLHWLHEMMRILYKNLSIYCLQTPLVLLFLAIFFTVWSLLDVVPLLIFPFKKFCGRNTFLLPAPTISTSSTPFSTSTSTYYFGIGSGKRQGEKSESCSSNHDEWDVYSTQLTHLTPESIVDWIDYYTYFPPFPVIPFRQLENPEMMIRMRLSDCRLPIPLWPRPQLILFLIVFC